MILAAVVGYCTLLHIKTPSGELGWVVRSTTYSVIVPYKWPGNYYGAIDACNKFSVRKYKERRKHLRASLKAGYTPHPCCLCECHLADGHMDCYRPCRDVMEGVSSVPYPRTAAEHATCVKICANAQNAEAR